MSEAEVEGVAAHEIAHIANGDMVTMTLIQGVMNAFVMFFARIIAFAVSQSVKSENRHMINFLVTIALQILLGILASIIVSWFSRQREFRADAGSARYSGREKMVAALKKLGQMSNRIDPREQHASFAALKISGQPNKFLALFSTHPPLSERIRRLESMS
jgi:heat shock protein HtpX